MIYLFCRLLLQVFYLVSIIVILLGYLFVIFIYLFCLFTSLENVERTNTDDHIKWKCFNTLMSEIIFISLLPFSSEGLPDLVKQ